MVDTKKIEEELPIELLQKGICITEAEAQEHEKLELTELEGSLLNGHTYEIDARGTKDGKRGLKDGISIFGIEKKDDETFVPDVAVNLEQEYVSKLKSPMIFRIYYRRDFQKFYLESVHDNVETFFLFILLEKPHKLPAETTVVSVQNYNFKLKISQDKKELTVEYGQSKNLTKAVLNNEKKKSFIIGRKPECDIIINETCISREQSIIFFDKGNWYIKDGGKDSSSTNGTWLFVEKKYQIQDSFTFKIGPSKMKVNVSNPNQSN